MTAAAFMSDCRYCKNAIRPKIDNIAYSAEYGWVHENCYHEEHPEMSTTINNDPFTPAPAPEPSKPKRKRLGLKIAGGAAAAVVAIVIVSGNGSSSKSTETHATTSVTATTSAAPSAPTVPAEYTAALKKAESYGNGMHMSKAGIYKQLTSEYGEKFSPAAAQYAVDNAKVDYNAQALAKAKTYQDSMSMSPAAIRDQLTSEMGEGFTAAQADYAIANLNK